MPEVPLSVYGLLALTAFLAGVLNSIAGGGTLLTFPTLMKVLAPLGPEGAAIANATSTVALMPGALAGTYGYRAELAGLKRLTLGMLPACIIGGGIGSGLLYAYPNEFRPLVPWLILSAALLFMIQPVVTRIIRRKQMAQQVTGEQDKPSTGKLIGLYLFQLMVAIYGGYFGAGIGILMLTALGFMAIGNIHQMNAVKTLLSASINAVAVVVFVLGGMVYWPFAITMAVTAILGGYVGARVARRFPPVIVRWMVVAIGFGLAIYYFTR